MGQELAEITSRRICCCVVTHRLLRRDASEAASWRNFSSLRASGAAYADETMFFIAQVHTFHWADTSDCAGLMIRLRWLEDMTSLSRRFEFVSRMRRICLQNEVAELAEWSSEKKACHRTYDTLFLMYLRCKYTLFFRNFQENNCKNEIENKRK